MMNLSMISVMNNGLYMIDENNMESHGSWDVAERTGDWTDIVPCDKEEWLDMMLDRVNSMYQRDKNHPAILIWSCGNESFGGKDIYEMSQFLKKRRSKPVWSIMKEFSMTGAIMSTSDMESQMYTSVKDIKKFSGKRQKQTFHLL